MSQSPFQRKITSNQIVACVPADASRLPRDTGLDDLLLSIVSAEHTKIMCSLCAEPCWIGPKQRQAVRTAGAVVACYLCLVQQQGYELNMQVLDPDAHKVPRRSSSWMVGE